MIDLFPIKETLSPRLKWMRRHQIETQKCELQSYCFDRLVTKPQWVEWLAGKQTKSVARYSFGDTEDESVADLAGKLNLKLWDEL